MQHPPTLRRWRELRQADETQPLYRKLWHLHYRRSLWASGLDYGQSLTYLTVSVLFSPIFILTPLAVSPLFGTYWAAFIAGMIRHEHQQGRYDLMALLPAGGIGAYTTIATLHMRRIRLFFYLDDALNITGLIGGIGAFLLVSGLLVGLATPQLNAGPERLALVSFVASVLLVLGWLYADQVQSVILSYEVGMAVPLYTGSALEARIWGAAAYIGLQTVLYGGALWAGFWLVPCLVPGGPALSILTAILLLSGMREALIYGLRRHVVTTLGQPHPESAP